MVGAVLVCDGRIIGEGYHRKYGEGHAEVNAIASVKDASLFEKSTLYVSLEPCSHYGKTPPCSDLIISKHIPRVVVGCLDPFPEVSGRGIARMEAAGIAVKTGVLEKEARALNPPFMTSHTLGRPFVLLKWAQSADGFMDRLRSDATVSPVALSSDETRRRVHQLRTRFAAILVGTRTALLDNPTLNVRYWDGSSPVRVVIDRTLKIPADYHLLDGRQPTLVFTEKAMESRPNVEFIQLDFQQDVISQLLAALKERRLNSLLVEGGAHLLNQFIATGLWDAAQVETAPVELQGGVKAPILSGRLTKVLQQGKHLLSFYRHDAPASLINN